MLLSFTSAIITTNTGAKLLLIGVELPPPPENLHVPDKISGSGVSFLFSFSQDIEKRMISRQKMLFIEFFILNVE